MIKTVIAHALKGTFNFTLRMQCYAILFCNFSLQIYFVISVSNFSLQLHFVLLVLQIHFVISV